MRLKIGHFKLDRQDILHALDIEMSYIMVIHCMDVNI